jgi:hypothetical protein
MTMFFFLSAGYGFLNQLFIERVGFSFFDRKSAFGTLSQACSQTIAKNIFNQSGLAVNYFDGLFLASRHAQTAAGTFFFIDFDDFALHKILPLMEEKIMLSANAADGGDRLFR